jgi:hypothetical protein
MTDFVFRPRLVDVRPGSNRDPDRVPRWYRECLGRVVEIEGRAIFQPGAHPSLKGFAPRQLGEADNSSDEMMAEAEKVFREAQRRKRAWRQAKKAAHANRVAVRLKEAA